MKRLTIEMTFREAAAEWLETREAHLAPMTFYGYGHYISILNKFFGDMRLLEIDGDAVRAYQQARRATAGPGSINKELGVLTMIRERVGVPLTDYQRLAMPKHWETPGRALTEQERETVERICQILSEHRRWKVAALAAMLSVNTGMTRCEMLSLKLKDCCLHPPSVNIQRRGAKRIRRERTVYLGEKGTWALEQLISRAIHECGAGDADHFLFPFKKYDHTFDPTRPAKGYRMAMEHVFELAGLKGKFKPNYFRHDAISRGLANPDVSVQAAISHFGWIGPKMIQRYYHAAQKEGQIVAAAIEAKEEVRKKWAPKKPSRPASQVWPALKIVRPIAGLLGEPTRD